MKLRSFARGATVVANVIAIAACGNRDVGTEAGSAELVVVVNTPIARAGAVAIHGPAASTMHVTATDTLRGLTAGEYLARADDASASDSLVSPVLNGVMSDSAVLLAADETRSITGTYTIRGGSGALWVGKWGTANLAEGFTSPQLAAAGVAAAADTVGSAGAMSTSSGTAFDSAGNLWVTDYINQEIHKYTPAQLASGASVPAVTISTQKEPWGIAFDTHGNLWVSFYNGNYVLRYAASDVAAWSGSLTDPAHALSIPTPIGPLGLAFDAQGNLWVAGFDVPQAYEIDAAQLGGSGSVLPTDSLMSAYLDHGSALAFDRAGNLWEGTELGYIVSYTPAQLSAASHGEPSFAQLTHPPPSTGWRSTTAAISGRGRRARMSRCTRRRSRRAEISPLPRGRSPPRRASERLDSRSIPTMRRFPSRRRSSRPRARRALAERFEWWLRTALLHPFCIRMTAVAPET